MSEYSINDIGSQSRREGQSHLVPQALGRPVGTGENRPYSRQEREVDRLGRLGNRIRSPGGETADAADLKSASRKGVGVRFPPWALRSP